MIKVKQHIPAFCEGFEPHLAQVANLDELLSLPWVHDWETEDTFDHFEQSKYADCVLLMAIMRNGNHWVVAYLWTPETLDLPQWRVGEALSRT
jgi:hypothetical protein